MYYRLDPVMRLIAANGGLPVLAVAAVLRSEDAHLEPGAVFTHEGDHFEVDLLAWRGTQVWAGEVKRRAGGFTDVGRDVLNSKLLGADVHIAATLDDVDAALEADLESACQSAGLQLRILDADTLLL